MTDFDEVEGTTAIQPLDAEKEFQKVEMYLQTMPGLKELDGLVAQGFTLQEIAMYYGMRTDTLYSMAKKHPVIYQAMADGRETLLDMIEQSLFDKCRPQKYVESRYKMDAHGTVLEMERKYKEVPADQKAIEYVLGNLRGGTWQQVGKRIDVNVSGRGRDDDLIIVNDVMMRDATPEEVEIGRSEDERREEEDKAR